MDYSTSLQPTVAVDKNQELSKTILNI